jgi:hypothetical protein
MIERPDREAACRWLLSVLVVLLVLGHLCDLEAFADLADHHASPAAGHTDELLSPCEPAPATSAPTLAQAWAALAASGDLPRAPAGLARVPRRFETAAWLVDRPPLFLLHASFLI